MEKRLFKFFIAGSHGLVEVNELDKLRELVLHIQRTARESGLVTGNLMKYDASNVYPHFQEGTSFILAPQCTQKGFDKLKALKEASGESRRPKKVVEGLFCLYLVNRYGTMV